ncbi:MAG: hypothetical protein KatS3mg038_2722 [Candidatus Kapaibacterium sp.]|nr:MAG: hypothetical protein KatS3mg038_2054 [Candidatus Kapabacteria bacterium]GIV52201.1 MAG: hypothetical protein KatS3mg038_2722 [Candidatus Kapabacteria bacterium]
MRSAYIEYPATIIRAVDGDTLHCELELGFGVLMRRVVRLARINAPEGKNTLAHVYLSSHVGARCLVQPHGCDKYGRVIAEVWLAKNDEDAINLSNDLLERGLVDEYHEHEALGAIFAEEENIHA